MFESILIFLSNFWVTLTQMAPYLLFGFLVAGIMSVFISSRTVERHLGSKGFWAILKASLFGVPMPLCSCGVIPVSMSLYKNGASKGATISFLISTPQTGLDNVFLIYSLLGPVFAVFSPIVAMLSGLFGGTMVSLFDRHDTRPSQPPSDNCDKQAKKENSVLKALRYAFLVLPADIGKAMLVGLILAAVISILMPDDFFSTYLAFGGGILAMLVMMAVGIPMYVCSAASVPIAAALVAKGLNPGAAMVFLMTGPATNAATFTTLWSVLGKKTAILYLVSVVIAAFTAGFLIDLFFRGIPKESICAHGDMFPAWFNSLCAVLLLLVLGRAIVIKKIKK
ncbi:MAG: SO_0444 family Cu/Zn efflux transporter [Sedimentisphaerales bacterium]|nr:SO_0444 family Cu/Zn efflux transporter [Sedimentisphaerales bacterium]